MYFIDTFIIAIIKKHHTKAQCHCIYCILIWNHLSWLHPKGHNVVQQHRQGGNYQYPCLRGLTAISVLYSSYSNNVSPNANSINVLHYSQYHHPMSFSKGIWNHRGKLKPTVKGLYSICNQLGVRRLQWGYIREWIQYSSYFSSLTSW